MSDLRLYLFECGWLRTEMHHINLNQGIGEPYAIPVPFFLLEHPRGNVLIDGGNALEVASDPAGHWGVLASAFRPTMTPAEFCVAQLEAIDVDPASVRYVVQSHLHMDHSGAVGHFPNARYVIQRRELEYAYTPDWFAAPGYVRADFDRDVEWLCLDGEATDAFDLYGDGAIRLYFTPGHSVGHQSALVTLGSGRTVLLAADAAYTRAHWEERALPGFTTSALETVRSVQKLHRLAEQTGALVVTGHDPDEWPALTRAPGYYE